MSLPPLNFEPLARLERYERRKRTQGLMLTITHRNNLGGGNRGGSILRFTLGPDAADMLDVTDGQRLEIAFARHERRTYLRLSVAQGRDGVLLRRRGPSLQASFQTTAVKLPRMTVTDAQFEAYDSHSLQVCLAGEAGHSAWTFKCASDRLTAEVRAHRAAVKAEREAINAAAAGIAL